MTSQISQYYIFNKILNYPVLVQKYEKNIYFYMLESTAHSFQAWKKKLLRLETLFCLLSARNNQNSWLLVKTTEIFLLKLLQIKPEAVLFLRYENLKAIVQFKQFLLILCAETWTKDKTDSWPQLSSLKQ